jgi:bifunctional non-homologous end joining protein LigD
MNTEDVAGFAHAVGRRFVQAMPDRLTQEFSKADRKGRIYVDTGRNGYSATFAAAYTVRAKRGAPVSAPCRWEEVERGDVHPRSFTLRTMAARLDAIGDLWGDMRPQSVNKAIAGLGSLRRRSRVAVEEPHATTRIVAAKTQNTRTQRRQRSLNVLRRGVATERAAARS